MSSWKVNWSVHCHLLLLLGYWARPSDDLSGAFVSWLAAIRDMICVLRTAFPCEKSAGCHRVELFNLNVLSIISKLPISHLSLDESTEWLTEVMLKKQWFIWGSTRSIFMNEDNCGVSGWGMGKRSEFPGDSPWSLHLDSQLVPEWALNTTC